MASRIKKPSRRDRLIEANPLCILCGGTRKAEQEEHAPGRNFFDNRLWPDGFSYPACGRCNGLTRNDEQLVAFSTRWNNARTEADFQDLKQRLTAVRNNCPEVKQKRPFSDNMMRRGLQAKGLPRIPGVPLSQHPLFLTADEYMPAIYRVGFKIAAGLHWKHADKKIIPSDAGCFVHLHTKSDKVFSPQAFWARLATGRSITMKNGKSLNDEFNYIYAEENMRDNGDYGIYVAEFRNTLTLVLLVFGKSELFDVFKSSSNHIQGGWPQPFSWPD